MRRRFYLDLTASNSVSSAIQSPRGSASRGAGKRVIRGGTIPRLYGKLRHSRVSPTGAFRENGVSLKIFLRGLSISHLNELR